MPIFVQVVVCAGTFMALAFLLEISRDLKVMRRQLHNLEMSLRKANKEFPFEEDHSEGEYRYQMQLKPK